MIRKTASLCIIVLIFLGVLITSACSGESAISGYITLGNINYSTLLVGMATDIEIDGAGLSGDADLPNSTDGYMWSSSNPQVATVDQSGTVRAQCIGTVTITVAFREWPYISASKDLIVDSVSIGSVHTLFLSADGSLWATGLNGDDTSRNFGFATAESTAIEPQKISSDIISAAAGINYSVIAKSDGTVWTTGDDSQGRLGNGDGYNNAASWTQVSGLSDIYRVYSGGTTSFALTTTGVLYGFGQNDMGQLGTGTTVVGGVHTPVEIATDVIEVSPSSSHTLIRKTDGSMWGTGDNSSGQLGFESPSEITTPIKLADNVVSMTAGPFYSLYVDIDDYTHTAHAAGSNYYGQLGNEDPPADVIEWIDVGSAYTVCAGNDHVLTTVGNVLHGVGKNSNGQLLGSFSEDVTSRKWIEKEVTGVAAGGNSTIYLKNDGTYWAFGENTNGQLGVGSIVDVYYEQEINLTE